MDGFQIDVWPAEQRNITQPFGVNPQIYQQFGAPGHTGIDIAWPESEGTRVFCAAPGRVTQIRNQPDGFGKHLFVQHANGYKTIYAHLQSVRVSQGQQLKAGDIVGLLGNSGFSSGPHLHFELRGPIAEPGYPRNIVDPTPFILPYLGFTRPDGPFKEGWVINWAVTIVDDLAQANAGGVSLRAGPGQNHNRLNVVPQGAMMIVNGAEQNDYVPVQVPFVSVGEQPPTPQPKPAPEFPPMVSTIDGWGFANYIKPDGGGLRGIVGQYGINLRAAPRRDAANIGVVKGGSAVTLMGAQSGEYLPVKVARNDFLGEINMVESSPPQPAPGVLSAHGGVSADTCLGWGWSQYMDVRGEKAVVGQYGINLRAQPSEFGAQVGVVKGLSVVTIVGESRGDYTPIMVNRADMVTLADPVPKVETPTPLEETPQAAAPAEKQTLLPSQPPQDSRPGWAFTSALHFRGNAAVAGEFGINLRANPRREAENIGFVPAGTAMYLVGAKQGEYTPVRVDAEKLQPPFEAETATSGAAPAAATPAAGATAPATPPSPRPVEPPILGQARLGLHASATPDISDAEINMFRALRPGIIKVLSFHSAEAIRRLARNHPDATWVVRAFLSFGGRNISPDQFVNDTLGDTRRALNELRGRDLVVELHNEPNLYAEGLGSTWRDGPDFNRWWLEVLGKYRQQLPGVHYIFPGLSPGPDAPNLRMADRPFLEVCRPAINAADGLGMHAYWSNPTFPMLDHPDSGVKLVDDYVRRFRSTPIWVTEASNNLGNDWDTKAREYIQFWQEMQKRPTVQGVTFFVASAAPGTFEHEVWLGHGIAQKLGAR